MVPELPTELWIIIIRLATEVVAELNANALSLFDIPSPTEVWQDRYDVLPTRRALTRVSRTFNIISIPFLYGSVTLTKGKAIQLLVRTLSSSFSHGNLIRRIDLNFKKSKLGDLEPADLSFLLKHVPNLQIIVSMGCWTIKYIDTAIESLQWFKNLRILGLGWEDMSFPTWEIIEVGACLPQLRVFHSRLSIQTSDLDPNLFPNLQGLICISSNPLWGDFLKVHGHKITHFTLSFYHLLKMATMELYLPNLRYVVTDIEPSNVDLFYISESQPNFVAFDRVKSVGCTNSGQTSANLMYTAFSLLLKIFPQAGCIRILEKRMVDALLRHKPGRLLRWHQDLKERGIRLEREDGVLLVASHV